MRSMFVGALLAATTGVVAASVISMGLISLPIMLRYGYDRALRLRRHRGVGHAGADHPALAGADRDGRPARPLGRRHVHGRARAGPGARRASMRSTCLSSPASAKEAGRRRCRWRRSPSQRRRLARLPVAGRAGARVGGHRLGGYAQLRYHGADLHHPDILGLAVGDRVPRRARERSPRLGLRTSAAVAAGRAGRSSC